MGQNLPFEKKLYWLALAVSLPASFALIAMMLVEDYSLYLTMLVVLTLAIQISWIAYKIQRDTAHQFRTMANLLDALTRGDYGMRGHNKKHPGALNELVEQINALTDTLSRQRIEVRESQLLLGKIINQINVAIFTLDSENRFALVNPAGCELLGATQESLLKQLAAEYGFDQLTEASHKVLQWQFPNAEGRYQIITDHFIEDNQRHTLIFVTNVQSMLREEERKAWQNLIRVISHEINNSLTPISSLSQTLLELLDSLPDNDAKPNLHEGLNVINDRAESLMRFIDSYRQLAKLPRPSRIELDMSQLLHSVIGLYPTTNIALTLPDALSVKGDPIQLKQLFINLLKNAVEAEHNKPIEIQIRCFVRNKKGIILIADNGTGISNPENIFTPFYSTKNNGNGIGLVLCRQIVEAHNGHLYIGNGAIEGCEVRVELPL